MWNWKSIELDFSLVLIYIALFGFSDIIEKHFNIKSTTARLFYYSILLLIGIFILIK